MKIIIQRGQSFASVNGHLMPINEVNGILFKYLKLGNATKLIDTNETLMYEVNTSTNL